MDESTLAGITTFVLHKVAVAGRRVIAERLAHKPGITLWQFAALAELDDHGPTAQHALAAGLGIDPSDMVRLMDELIEDRLVARDRDPADHAALPDHLDHEGPPSTRHRAIRRTGGRENDPGAVVGDRARHLARPGGQDLRRPLRGWS